MRCIYHVSDCSDEEAGLVKKSDDSRSRGLDQVTDDPVVEIVNLERGEGERKKRRRREEEEEEEEGGGGEEEEEEEGEEGEEEG